MPTVYYTDGTFKKYKFYYDLIKDPYLKLNDNFIKLLNENDKYYGASYFEKNYTTKDIPFEDCLKTGNILEKVKLDEITERILKTNSINICGISEFIDCKYGYSLVCFPMIDKNLICKLEDMFPNIKKIILSNNNLDKDDINFLKFKKCEVIKLNKNEFSSIPPDFCYLNNLRILNIKGKYTHFPPYGNENEFIIPNYINKLKNLEVLNLSNNNIKTIPSEIGDLIKLKKLIMTHTDFKILPKEIGNLNNLQLIDFSFSSLSELPKEIGKLNKLKQILLQATKCKIPKEIGLIENLKILVANGLWDSPSSKCDSYESGILFSHLPIEIWNTNISRLYVDDFNDEFDINNFDYFLLQLFKSKKNIFINDNYIYNKNNLIIIYDIDTKKKKHSFTFKNNKLYKIINDELKIIKMKLKDHSFDNDYNIIPLSKVEFKIINEIKNDWQRILSVSTEYLTSEMYLMAIKSMSDLDLDPYIYTKKIEYLIKNIPRKLINDELCFFLINKKNFSYVLEYVKNQTSEICLTAVQNHGLALKHVKLQTPEICLAAVKQCGMALEYVKEQTHEICMAAVQRYGRALKSVKKQTPEICLAAVQNDDLSDFLQDIIDSKDVKDQTPEICLEEGEGNSQVLQYVKVQTSEICLAAVKRSWLSLKHVENQTPEICLIAVQNHGWALKYVKNQTPEICLDAVKNNKYALQYVKIKTPFKK